MLHKVYLGKIIQSEGETVFEDLRILFEKQILEKKFNSLNRRYIR